jgi:hypothetical protein
VVEHVDRVVRADADVAQVLLADALEQCADAGLVHLAAEEVLLRHQRGDVRRGFAHPEADLQHGGRVAAEGFGQVQRRFAVGEQEARAVHLVGARLAFGRAAAALDEALQAAMQRVRLAGGAGCRRGLGFIGGRRIAREVGGHGTVHQGRGL